VCRESAIQIKVDFFVLFLIFAVLKFLEGFLDEERPNLMPKCVKDPKAYLIDDLLFSLLAGSDHCH
jgi:hypothetical protein